MKLRAFLKIGNGIIACVRCGCTDIRFLEANHKNGGGRQERKTLGGSTIRAVASGRRKTDDLELTCKPCNAIHALELKYGYVPLKVIPATNPPHTSL